ncbi:MAG TPA: indole-3-glycerol phosphate synthase TrpC [Vicinamibacterales bacterium]|nr:indole-3-glycerol phosphate synthase TrpC [Vicinamibacterales bacterium]
MTGAGDLLETIVAAARASASVREARLPAARLAITRRPAGERFVRALRETPAPRVIAECKRRSPSRGILRREYEPASHAAAYAAAGAAAISVLTEPTFFDGHPEHLRAVRAAVDLPLLRKDFIVTEYQVHEAAALGADAVLLIAGALDDASLRRLHGLASSLGLASLVEVHDRDELDRAVDAGAGIIGVNSRNLRTLAVYLELFEHLAPHLPAGTIAVAESGIRTAADLRRLATLGYSAFLVGERLIAQPDPGAALRELRG